MPSTPLQWDKDTVRTVIFEADTPAGRAFDLALILAILTSVAAVFIDTVPHIHEQYGDVLYIVEWVFTLTFAIEYGLRLWCINNPLRYARSFYGVVDLLGILPTFVSLFIPGTQHLLVVRILRVLRVFRVLRMVRYVGEADLLMDALRGARRKITVFIMTVMVAVVVFGSLMYLVEGEEGGFTSIPKSIYWAVVTMTTVGYGDVAPVTPLGQALASLVMILGYGVIAVPTGIVTLEISEANRRRANTRVCPECTAEGHSREATYCWRCGQHLYRKPRSVGEPGLTEIRLPEEPQTPDPPDSDP